MSQTLGNIVSKMGLGGTSPPFVTIDQGAPLWQCRRKEGGTCTHPWQPTRLNVEGRNRYGDEEMRGSSPARPETGTETRR